MPLDNTTVKQAGVFMDASIAGLKEKQDRVLDYFTDEIKAAYSQYEEEVLDAKGYLLRSQSARIGSGFLPDDARDAIELLEDAEEKLKEKLTDITNDVTTNLANMQEQVIADMIALKGLAGGEKLGGIIGSAKFIRVAEKQLALGPFADKFAEMEVKTSAPLYAPKP